jgi:hypothetical protein
VRSFFEQLAGSNEFSRFDPHDFISSGDFVVALVAIEGHPRATGVNVAEEVAHVFRIRAGRVCEFREYADARAVVAAYTRRRQPLAPEETGASAPEHVLEEPWHVGTREISVPTSICTTIEFGSSATPRSRRTRPPSRASTR